MSDLTLRLQKGSRLTYEELDQNFINLNTDKYESGDDLVVASITANGDVVIAGNTTSDGFIVTGGTSSQFLKADGSLDSTNYNDTLDSVTARGNTTLNSITIGGQTVNGQIINNVPAGSNNPQIYKAHDATGGVALAQNRARGTLDIPTALIDGDIVGGLNGLAYDGTEYSLTAALRYKIDGTVSTGIVPQKIVFETSETDGNGLAERLTIKPNGQIIIGEITNPASSDRNLEIYAPGGPGGNGLDRPSIRLINNTLDDYASNIEFFNQATRSGYITFQPAGLIFASEVANTDISFVTDTAGTAVTIKDDGKVGVGTTDPTGKLDIVSSSGVCSVKIISEDGSNSFFSLLSDNTNHINFRTVTDDILLSQIRAQSTDESLRLRTGGNTVDGLTDRLVIDSAGDVVINESLTIGGDLIVSGNTTTVDTINLDVQDSIITLNKNQPTPLNDIGILMQRYENATSTNYNVGIVWEEGSDRLIFGKTPEDGADNDISFNTEWMTITDGGNVGIGITNPFADSGYTSIDVRGSTGGQIHFGTPTNRYAQISAEGTNGITYNTIGSLGHRFFIGGAPKVDITTTGDISINGTTGTGKVIFSDPATPRNNYIGMDGYDNITIAADEDNAGTDSTIKFRVDAAQQMQISSSRVSIALTSASTSTTTGALTVAGGVGIGGDLYVSDIRLGGSGTIAGATWANGTFHLGTSGSGWAMDPNELYNSAAALIGTLTGDLTLNPVAGSVLSGRPVSFTNTTQSTTTTTGALKVAGGVGISKDVFIGGQVRPQTIYVQSNTYTTTTDVALTANGVIRSGSGLWVAGNGLNFGVTTTDSPTSGWDANVTSALTITNAGAATFAGTVTAPNLTLSSLSASATEATSLFIDGSNNVVTRELGSNAFTSTVYYPDSNPDGYISSLAFNDLTSKTGGTGDYATTGDLIAGLGSGGVALTVNDGDGNANVTFNHRNGDAEQAGNVARIEVNTDSTTGATMYFEVQDNATAGAITINNTGMSLTKDTLTINNNGTAGGGTLSAGLINATNNISLKGTSAGSNNVLRFYVNATEYGQIFGGSNQGMLFYATSGNNFSFRPNASATSVFDITSSIAESAVTMQVSKTIPVLSLNDTDATNTTNQTGWISFKSQGTETGWVGFGDSVNDKLTVRNIDGPVVLYPSTEVQVNSDLDVTGALGFGSTTRQMLNLYGTSYALGVQSSTLYYRTGSAFAWFRGGVHNGTQYNAGTGGTLAMKLDASSNLTVTGTLTASGYNNANWDTAYGWGDHAGLYPSISQVSWDGTANQTGTTTAALVSWLNTTQGLHARKTSWSYAGNGDLTDAGNLTETAGTVFQTWSDGTYHTTLVIAPNTGGSAYRTMIYNDQGSSYSPGWREILTDKTYNSFVPSLTGTGASGTWGINITGSAGSATTATTATNLSGGTVSATSITSSLNIYSGGGNVDVASGDNRVKFGMWGSGDVTYGIGMDSAYTYGGLNDYALTFQMDNTADRGFWWGDTGHTNAQGAMSLTTDGILTVATSIGVGRGQSYTADPVAPLEVTSAGRAIYINGFTQTTMATATSGLGAIEIVQDTVNHDSFMTFHVANDYAIYFGLDGTTNRLGWGGWSASNFKYQIASMGITNTGNFSATGNITAYSSDERLKENVKPIENALEKLHNISGVTFDWTDESEELGFVPQHKKNDAGVIAQRVQEVLPQAVAPAPFDLEMNPDDGMEYSKSGKDYLTVQYEKLTPLLIEAVKEQNQLINNQQAQIDELRQMIMEMNK